MRNLSYFKCTTCILRIDLKRFLEYYEIDRYVLCHNGLVFSKNDFFFEEKPLSNLWMLFLLIIDKICFHSDFFIQYIKNRSLICKVWKTVCELKSAKSSSFQLQHSIYYVLSWRAFESSKNFLLNGICLNALVLRPQIFHP